MIEFGERRGAQEGALCWTFPLAVLPPVDSLQRSIKVHVQGPGGPARLEAGMLASDWSRCRRCCRGGREISAEPPAHKSFEEMSHQVAERLKDAENLALQLVSLGVLGRYGETEGRKHLTSDFGGQFELDRVHGKRFGSVPCTMDCVVLCPQPLFCH